MELKAYFDNLRELTKTKQVKWVRRAMAGQHIFDTKINEEHTITLHFDVMIGRASITVVHQGNAIGIANLDANGDSYKALAKLWDTILIINLGNPVEKWHEVLPELDKKIKFGPKEKTRI